MLDKLLRVLGQSVMEMWFALTLPPHFQVASPSMLPLTLVCLKARDRIGIFTYTPFSKGTERQGWRHRGRIARTGPQAKCKGQGIKPGAFQWGGAKPGLGLPRVLLDASRNILCYQVKG